VAIINTNIYSDNAVNDDRLLPLPGTATSTIHSTADNISMLDRHRIDKYLDTYLPITAKMYSCSAEFTNDVSSSVM